jgi:hypothetical protein
MAASLNDLLAQMIGGNMPANPRRQQDIAPLATDTGAAAQSPGQNMLGSVLSNTLYQQLMPLLNTLNARRISNVITNDQYYNTPNNYTYKPGDTNPPPTVNTNPTPKVGTNPTPTVNTTTFTPTTTTAAKGPYDDLLNSIYQQEFGRAYNPSTDAWWTQQLQSGIENTSTAAAMNKLMHDIAGGARNVAGGTQDLTYEQAHPYAQANTTTPTTGATTTPTTGGKTTPTSVDPTALLNQIYQSDFNRAPDTSGLSYWQSQLASDPSLLNDPGKLAQIIGGGASSGSSDAAAYAKNMTVNPVTVKRDGGPVHAHRTNPMYYHNGKWYHH